MANSRPLPERLLNSPNLARVVPRLKPEILHRVIRAKGLEDCNELIAAATPAQLTRVLDADVWRAGQPGADETLDADRFGLWLEVLMESGATVAAAKLMGLDQQLVVAGFASHVRVFDRAAVTGDYRACEIGRYVLT